MEYDYAEREEVDGYELPKRRRLPPQYRPLGAWAYFGYNILFMLPLVGLVFLIIFSFNNSNINRRNFARSYFCVYAILLIIALIVFLIVSLSAIKN